MTNLFTLAPRGPFSMEPIRELQCGFLRGTRRCDAGETVRLAFPLDRTHAITGVRLRWDGRLVHGEVTGGAEPEAVARQVARILAVDHDATQFARVLEADPALRRVGDARPGFRPVVAYSPYVMAGWSVLSQRLRMSQAAALQRALAEATGDVADLDGERVASFPRPGSLLALDGFPGVSAEKWARLQAVARAALDGRLDVDHLAALPLREARARLLAIRGVGAWTAEAILIRGCGATDLLPLGEPTLHGAVAVAYGLGHVPDDAEVTAIARAWQPFRTWVSVLLISAHFAQAQAHTRTRARGRGARGAQGRG